jgi:hypothetical protein
MLTIMLHLSDVVCTRFRQVPAFILVTLGLQTPAFRVLAIPHMNEKVRRHADFGQDIQDNQPLHKDRPAELAPKFDDAANLWLPKGKTRFREKEIKLQQRRIEIPSKKPGERSLSRAGATINGNDLGRKAGQDRLQPLRRLVKLHWPELHDG